MSVYDSFKQTQGTTTKPVIEPVKKTGFFDKIKSFLGVNKQEEVVQPQPIATPEPKKSVYEEFKATVAPKTTGSVYDQFKGNVAPKEESFFYKQFPSGATIGKSDQLDSSGRPLFAYRNPGDNATSTDPTRTATKFDPTKAQPLTKDQYYNAREEGLRDKYKEIMGIDPDEELDHAIALTVGGSNQPENLRSIPKEKNRQAGAYELFLSEQLRDGKISYLDAQVANAKAKKLTPPWVPPELKGADNNTIWDAIKEKAKNLLVSKPVPLSVPPVEKVDQPRDMLKDTISPAKTSFFQKVVDKIRSTPEGNTLVTGLIGEGQGVDITGKESYDGGLLNFFRFFGIGKSDYEKVTERYNALVNSGIDEEQATKVAISDGLKDTKKDAINEALYGTKKIELTPEENKALRWVKFSETLDSAFGALDIVSLGTTKPLTSAVRRRLAETIINATEEGISTALRSEFKEFTQTQADELAKVFARNRNIDDTERALDRIAEGINTKATSPVEPTKQVDTVQVKKEINYPNKEPESGVKVYGSIRENDVAKLDSIEIKPNKQNQGLGTKYVKDFENWAVNNGAKKVVIDAYKGSVDFWQKQGYKLDKDFPVIDGIKQDYKSGYKDLSVKDTDFLVQEAKKYKSSEEYVKAQGEPVYEGEKDLSTKTLEKLKGKSEVSKQYIQDLAKSADIKEVERNTITEVLAQYPDNAKIPVVDFAGRVNKELLPLERKTATTESNNDTQRHAGITLKGELAGDVKKYDEHVYESPIKTSAGRVHFSQTGTENYFGHTRTEDMADNTTRRVIEVQSDLYQKGRLEKEVGGTLSSLPETEYRELIQLEKDRMARNLSAKESERYEYLYNRADELRKKEISPLKQYNNPTAHFRMVREEIKKASQDNKNKLQFPTGETAMKIEGLGQNINWYDNAAERVNGVYPRLKPEQLKVGMEVRQYFTPYIVTDVLGDGKFKAVPKDKLLNPDYNKGLKSYNPGFWNIENALKEAKAEEFNALGGLIETFDISGKVDTNNPIYKFYEKELGKYLKNNHNAKLVTDKQGVTWWELDVNPDTAEKPVVAFKEKKTKNTGDITIEEAKTRISQLFDDKEIKFITGNDLTDLLDETVSKKFALEGLFKRTAFGPDLLAVVENNGKVFSSTLYHESFHAFFQGFVSKEERKELLDYVKNNLLTRPKTATYSRKMYTTLDDRAEEWLADDFAEYVRTKTADPKLEPFYRRWLNKIREWIRNRGNLKDLYERILKKDRSVVVPKDRTLKVQSFKAKKQTQFDEIEEANRKWIESEAKTELTKKAEELLKTLKENPKLKELKTAKELLEDQIKSHPARNLLKYRNPKTGELPEVTGEDTSIFRKSGDDIAKEAGFEDSEQARQAVREVEKLQSQLKRVKYELQEQVLDVRDKVQKAQDEMVLNKLVQKQEKHISEILGDEQKKKEAIERARKSIEESTKRIAQETLYHQAYLKKVEDAHRKANPKGVLHKIYKTLGPIGETDPVTQVIYSTWKAKRITAKELANDTEKSFIEDGYNNINDLGEIMAYQAGKKTPWIKEHLDAMWTEAKRRGLPTRYREDYFPQVYKEQPEEIRKALVEFLKKESGMDETQIKAFLDEKEELPEKVALRLKMTPSFDRKKYFPDYATAIRYGLTPKYMTIPQHFAYYREEMEKVIANKEMVDSFIREGKFLDAQDAPDSWVEVKLPGLSRRTYYAEPILAKTLNDQFMAVEDVGLAEYLMKVGSSIASVMQAIRLSGGIPFTTINYFAFGQVIKALTTGLGALAKGDIPLLLSELNASKSMIRAMSDTHSLEWFKENQIYIHMMAKEGINLENRIGAYDDLYKSFKSLITQKARADLWQSIKDGKNTLFSLKSKEARLALFGEDNDQKIATLMRLFAESRGAEIVSKIWDFAMNRKVFQSMIPQMQIEMFKRTYEKAKSAGLPDEEASAFAGGLIKNEFGTILDLGRTKMAQNTINTIFMAPRFRETLINFFWNTGKAFTTERKNPLYTNNRAFILGAMISFAIYQLINKSMNDEYTWENESGRKFSIKLNLPNGDLAYLEFLPSVFATPRMATQAVLAASEGDIAETVHQASGFFSMPINLVGEILSNKDHFGRNIYNIEDTVDEKLIKSVAHAGDALLHPYIVELKKYFQDKQPLYQALSIMMEVPLKYSNLAKESQSKFFEAKNKQTVENKKQRKDVKKEYEKIKKLVLEGKRTEAETAYKMLSLEEQEIYKSIKKSEQTLARQKAERDMYGTVLKIRDLVNKGRKDEAQVMYDKLTDAQKEIFATVKKKYFDKKK